MVQTPGYCKDHQAQANRQYNVERVGRNLQTDRWYHTARWQKLRASVLAEEPLCRMCCNSTPPRTTTAVLVDHIRPVKHEGDFWDHKNLQPLCNHCHELKSQAEGSRTPLYALHGRTHPPAPARPPAPPRGGRSQGGAGAFPPRRSR